MQQYVIIFSEFSKLSGQLISFVKCLTIHDSRSNIGYEEALTFLTSEEAVHCLVKLQ
jgi:hypothetical protein